MGEDFVGGGVYGGGVERGELAPGSWGRVVGIVEE